MVVLFSALSCPIFSEQMVEMALGFQHSSWLDPAILTTLIVGLGISILGYKGGGKLEQQKIRSEFERSADNYASTFQHEIDAINLAELNAIKRFFHGSFKVDRNEFKIFTKDVLQTHRSILALEWVPRVLDADRQSFEQSAGHEGVEGFRIFARDSVGKMVSAKKQHEYFPVLFVEPLQKNRSIVGFDLLSDPARAEIIIQAAALGEMRASEPLQLMQGERGVVVIAPVYRGNPVTPSERRAALRGLILGVYSTKNLLESVVGASGKIRQGEIPTEFHLYDITDPKTSLEVYVNGSSELHESNEQKAKDIDLSTHRPIQVAGRVWKMEFFPTALYLESRHWIGTAWGVFCLGLMITLFVAIWFRSALQRQQIIEEKIREQTAEILVAKNEAENANQAKSLFLAKVTHELKTPLTSILSLADRLQRKAQSGYSLTNRDAESILRMFRSAKMLQVQIQDILDLSKIEVGELDLVRVEACLNAIVQEAFEDFVAPENLAIQLQLASCQMCENSPVKNEKFDQHRIKQVINNLLSNAIKFTAEGTITIRSDVTDEGLQVSVLDTGIGIASDQAGLIFQDFTQADDSITRRFGGTGLGLTISKKIIEMHGGRLWLEKTELGKGSEFRFIIPFEIQEEV